MLTAAKLDRILHHSTIVNISGETFGLKDKHKAGVLGAMNLSGVSHRLFHRFTDVQETGQGHRLLHSHEHSHDGHRHSHLHIHLFARGHETIGTLGLVRALGVGIVHGLAGSAAIALLVLSTIHDPLRSVLISWCSESGRSPE